MFESLYLILLDVVIFVMTLNDVSYKWGLKEPMEPSDFTFCVDFEPFFVRPLPVLSEMSDEEIVWLNPEQLTLLKPTAIEPLTTSSVASSSSSSSSSTSSTTTTPSPLFSSTSNNNTNTNVSDRLVENENNKTVETTSSLIDTTAEFKLLVEKAFQTPLAINQIQKIVSTLQANPNLIHVCGLTPKRLPQIVENNPNLAIEFLLKLTSSSQITEYDTHTHMHSLFLSASHHSFFVCLLLIKSIFCFTFCEKHNM